jgi:hypothetical protein
VPYANLTNPQTLNLYAMVTDDPESFADLDGHELPAPGGGLGLIHSQEEENYQEIQAAFAADAAQAQQQQQAQAQQTTQAQNQSEPVLIAQNQDPNQSQNSSSSSSSSGGRANTPAQGQPPDTTVTIPKPNGGSTDRTFGPDGRAVKDVDSGHAHDPEPHAHDWDWSKTPPRQPRRDLTPEEKKQVATAAKWMLVYWIISEGSRILFPPRNLVPVP